MAASEDLSSTSLRLSRRPRSPTQGDPPPGRYYGMTQRRHLRYLSRAGATRREEWWATKNASQRYPSGSLRSDSIEVGAGRPVRDLDGDCSRSTRRWARPKWGLPKDRRGWTRRGGPPCVAEPVRSAQGAPAQTGLLLRTGRATPSTNGVPNGMDWEGRPTGEERAGREPAPDRGRTTRQARSGPVREKFWCEDCGLYAFDPLDPDNAAGVARARPKPRQLHVARNLLAPKHAAKWCGSLIERTCGADGGLRTPVAEQPRPKTRSLTTGKRGLYGPHDNGSSPGVASATASQRGGTHRRDIGKRRQLSQATLPG